MKKLFFLLSLMASSGLQAQCFQAPYLNKVLEKELKKKCESFPAKLSISNLSLEFEGNDTLYASDFERLPSIENLRLSADYSNHIVLKLKGDIRLPKLGVLYIYAVKSFDDSEGTIQMPSAIYDGPYWQGLSLKDLPQNVTLTHTNSLHFDFNGRSFRSLDIYGAGSVTNLGITERLQVHGNLNERSKVSNLKFSKLEILSLHTADAVLDGPVAVDYLNLTSARVTGGAIAIKKDFNMLYFTNVEFECAEIPYKKVTEIGIVNSKINGCPLKEALALKKFILQNSEFSLDVVPDLSKATVVTLGGKGMFPDEELNLDLGKDLEALTIMELDVKTNITLNGTSNLTSLTLLDPGIRISSRKSVPWSTKVVTSTKAQADELKKILKADAVYWLNWTEPKKVSNF